MNEYEKVYRIKALETTLADTEARIKHLENEQALLLENLIEAKHRIEALETALAAVVRALADGETVYHCSLTPEHRHALCGPKTARFLIDAAEALNINIGLE